MACIPVSAHVMRCLTIPVNESRYRIEVTIRSRDLGGEILDPSRALIGPSSFPTPQLSFVDGVVCKYGYREYHRTSHSRKKSVPTDAILYLRDPNVF